MGWSDNEMAIKIRAAVERIEPGTAFDARALAERFNLPVDDCDDWIEAAMDNGILEWDCHGDPVAVADMAPSYTLARDLDPYGCLVAHTKGDIEGALTGHGFKPSDWKIIGGDYVTVKGRSEWDDRPVTLARLE